MKTIACLLLSALLSLSAVAHEADPGAALITPAALTTLVADLCADGMDGRLPGTEGYRRAAAYAVGRFAELGLVPGGDDGGWFQHFPMELNVIRTAELELVGADGAVRTPTLGTEWACRGFTGSGDVAAEVVFVGYGLSHPEQGYDDYAGIDVRGRIVLALKPAPGWQVGEEGFTPAHLPRAKAAAAKAHGAAGLLLVGRPSDIWSETVIASVLHGDGEYVPDVPAAQIGVADAGRLFAGGLQEFATVLKEIDDAHAPRSRVLPARVHLNVAAEYTRAADAVNVVGVLPGADTELGREVLVIGGHLDHVGAQADVVWPGANDNASGAAAVLGLAEAFARGGLLPRRTVVFVLFAGEEQGLNGAEHYVAAPAFPLAETVAMFNLDCVAHGDSISLGGGETQPVLWRTLRDLDADHARLSVAQTWPGGGADAQPFFDAGVPTLYFASKFSYKHLHQVSDTPETLNPALHAELVRLAYRGAVEVAQGRYAGEVPPAE